jgi:hypothetical protein
MQTILKTDPHYVVIASQDGRLYLSRTVGSLSGGTRVTVVAADSEYQTLKVRAKISRQQQRIDAYRTIEVDSLEVVVKLDDLVIRRMSCHPDALIPEQQESRKTRRRKTLAARRVLEELKSKREVTSSE